MKGNVAFGRSYMRLVSAETGLKTNLIKESDMAIQELKANEVNEVSGGEWWDTFAYGLGFLAAATYSVPPLAAYLGGSGALIGFLGNITQGEDLSDITLYNAMGDFSY